MKVYLDSSVALGRILEDHPGAVTDTSGWQQVVSSELLSMELYRCVDRLRIIHRFNDAQLADRMRTVREVLVGVDQVSIQPAVLRRVCSSFPTVLGTLDAIHLATALLWMEEHDEPLTFLTHDAQLATAAQACGLDVLPPQP